MCYSAIVVARNAYALKRATVNASGSSKRRWPNRNKARFGRSVVRLNDGPFLSERMIAGVDFVA